MSLAEGRGSATGKGNMTTIIVMQGGAHFQSLKCEKESN